MANRLRNVLLGLALLIVGVVGLFLPVSVFDGHSSTIGCGNAVKADLSAAQAANAPTPAGIPAANQVVPHSDYVAGCESSIDGRRRWAIPLAIVGAVGLLVGLLYRGKRGDGRPGRT
ncbi:MAG: hypothetical protein QOD39_227 [Mycobacterium sp.]|nr:hypothetical protein [Mycobacterium sp.]